MIASRFSRHYYCRHESIATERGASEQMTEQVELSNLDLRYQSYRLRNALAEKRLLHSLLETGIRDPLQGVDSQGSRILLNGFKRYRCARKLGLDIVPYCSLSDDEAHGILELLRIANARSLSILEQAQWIHELHTVHGLCQADIARLLERSKAWVNVRTGMLLQLTPTVLTTIMKGDFPAYSWLYTVRPFMRLNAISKHDVEGFVQAVAGHGLSTRDIEVLAQGYFKGPENLREQIRHGQLGWVLGQLKHSDSASNDCSSSEQAWLRDLEIIQKTVNRLLARSPDDRCQSVSFHAQAHLLTGGIVRQLPLLTTLVEALHDRSRQAQSDLPTA